MLFKYKVIDKDGQESEGSIDASSVDIAITSLQKRGLVIATIKEANSGFLNKKFNIFSYVKNRDLVIVSRQIATLFSAQVSALRVFRILSEQSESAVLGRCFG